MRKFIFRGQSNKNLNSQEELVSFKPWMLELSLKRKFKNDLISNDDNFLIKETENLLSYIEKRSKLKSERLNVLAEMHHSGMPMFLIEFSKDLNQDLFFAFENNNFFF